MYPFIAFLSNFGEGRGAITTNWWLVIPVAIIIVGVLIYKNTKGRR